MISKSNQMPAGSIRALPWLLLERDFKKESLGHMKGNEDGYFRPQAIYKATLGELGETM